MSKYAMSDLHGCYDKYMKMLELIEFNDNDELYILGDIFDRGKEPLNILDHIIANKNIHLIKGNHEKMFEDYFEDGDANLWYMNGGGPTHCQITHRGYDYEQQLYHYIRRLPLYKVVDNFLLTHAGVNINGCDTNIPLEVILKDYKEDVFLWDRSNIGCDFNYNGYKLIVGHTPVQNIVKGSKTILNMNGTYYIDCGAVFKVGALACLRLDDMKEFYLE